MSNGDEGEYFFPGSVFRVPPDVYRAEIVGGGADDGEPIIVLRQKHVGQKCPPFEMTLSLPAAEQLTTNLIGAISEVYDLNPHLVREIEEAVEIEDEETEDEIDGDDPD